MGYVPPKSTAPNAGAVLSDPAEQRAEERRSADGWVCLMLDQEGTIAVEGRLMDLSTSGFRALHRNRDLSPGRVVRFQLTDDSADIHRAGWARVIWSRLDG